MVALEKMVILNLLKGERVRWREMNELMYCTELNSVHINSIQLCELMREKAKFFTLTSNLLSKPLKIVLDFI